MIAAEALVAQVGILPLTGEMLTKADGRAARDMPALWRTEIAGWLEQKKPRGFTLPRQRDFERTLKVLSDDLPDDLFTQLTDQGLSAECKVLIERGRAYALSKWPVRHLDRPTGPELLKPGVIELTAANSIVAVLDDPDRFVDELRMESVTKDQLDAMRSVYPGLLDMAIAIMWDEIDRLKLTDGYSMRWETELVIRRLVSLPPQMSIAKADRPPPATASPTISAKFDDLKTRAQKVAEL